MADLFLPSELLDLEGHLKWFSNLLPSLEVSMVAAGSDVETYLAKTIQQEVQKSIHENDGVPAVLEGEAEDGEGSDLTTLPTFADSLNKITAHLLLRQVESAKKILQEVTGQTILLYQNGDEKVDGGHLAVAKYLLEYMEHCVATLECLEGGKGDPIQLMDQRDQLIIKWEEEFKKADGSVVTATKLYFQGSLAAWLKVDYDGVLELLKKSINLDPDYYIWYLEAYRTLIILRYNKNRDATVSGPSRMEHEMCEKAYQLCPNDVSFISLTLNYAKLAKDELWCKKFPYWTENQDKVKKCLKIFEIALEMAEEAEFHGDLKKKRKLVKNVKREFSDFLLFGNDNKLGRARGKRMLESCLETHSTSTFVLHKLAKLHNLGVFVWEHGKVYVDLEKAKDFYQRALATDPGNKPCVLGYLKFLGKIESHSEMMEVIDKAIASYHSIDHQIKFKIERGCIWKCNPLSSEDHKSDACASWMNVIQQWPNRIDDIYEAIKGPQEKPWQTGIAATEVVAALRAFAEDDVGVNQLILKLTGAPVFRKKRPYFKKSAADNDGNWRQK